MLVRAYGTVRCTNDGAGWLLFAQPAVQDIRRYVVPASMMRHLDKSRSRQPELLGTHPCLSQPDRTDVCGQKNAFTIECGMLNNTAFIGR
ncbi:MAG: hypothetical protein DI562_00280 [Stenotrophomonas acidaminiphila]|nr:MAG: hypothetical protein DI562_00280 [Stenotrophomonas acidaminiphila]